MTERRKSLLGKIIEEYIKTAEPVGSEVLGERYSFDLSPATIRNEMALLENEGYISKPHSSSGRLPTEEGYRFYLKHFLEEKKLTLPSKKALESILREAQFQDLNLVKNLAKVLARMSHQAVVVGFTPSNVYWTGLSNLFSQPEFRDFRLIYNFSDIIDHLDETITSLFKEIDKPHPFFQKVWGKGINILIGQESPFGEECSVIITKYKLPYLKRGLLGILGPMRMDYETNVALIKYVRERLICKTIKNYKKK